MENTAKKALLFVQVRCVRVTTGPSGVFVRLLILCLSTFYRFRFLNLKRNFEFERD